MSRLHICNTFFEQELEGRKSLSLKRWLSFHPAIEQLQFLPLLYAEKSDLILVSKLPRDPDPRLVENAPTNMPIESWGASEAIAHFAKEHKLHFFTPPLSLVREIHSKAFAFLNGIPLPGAALLSNPKEAKQWIDKTPGPKVLKKILSYAGQGHFFFDKSPQDFLNEEFSQNRPVIGEPWVERSFDFSSQWNISENIELLGLTVFETSSQGVYQATLAGKDLLGEYEWAAEKHLEIVFPILQKIQRLGFFGSLGIDAFVYYGKLHPIVEINARKTMSWAAMQIHKNTGQNIRMSFEKKPGGLLPGSFSRNIFLFGQ